MKIAVFDTYVHRPDGLRMHFDILVDDRSKDISTVLSHGRRYLASKGLVPEALTAHECSFCHTETGHPQIEAEILKEGFAIIEMENCH